MKDFQFSFLIDHESMMFKDENFVFFCSCIMILVYFVNPKNHFQKISEVAFFSISYLY